MMRHARGYRASRFFPSLILMARRWLVVDGNDDVGYNDNDNRDVSVDFQCEDIGVRLTEFVGVFCC